MSTVVALQLASLLGLLMLADAFADGRHIEDEDDDDAFIPTPIYDLRSAVPCHLCQVKLCHQFSRMSVSHAPHTNPVPRPASSPPRYV